MGGFIAKFPGTCCYCRGHHYQAGERVHTVKTADGRTLYGAEKCWQRMKVEKAVLDKEFKEVTKDAGR
jgi:hypothetical protein